MLNVLDFHENRGNESGRLNSSRRSMSSRNTSINLPEPDLIVSLVEGRGTAKVRLFLCFQIRIDMFSEVYMFLFLNKDQSREF